MARNNTRNTTVNHTLQGVQPISQFPSSRVRSQSPEGVTEEGAAEEIPRAVEEVPGVAKDILSTSPFNFAKLRTQVAT